MGDPYSSIASSIFSLAQVAYRIYDAWASAPDICARASRQLGSVNLALTRIAKKIEDSARNPRSPLARSGGDKKAELADLLELLRVPLKKLEELVTKYERSGKGAWARIMLGGMVKGEIEDNVAEIQFHMSTLQVLYLSLTDERFFRFDYNINKIFDEERKKDETSSLIYSLADGDRAEDGWRELLKKFAQLHYEMEAMNEHRRDIERYVKLKMAAVAKKDDDRETYNQLTRRLSLESIEELPRPPTPLVPPRRPESNHMESKQERDLPDPERPPVPPRKKRSGCQSLFGVGVILQIFLCLAGFAFSIYAVRSKAIPFYDYEGLVPAIAADIGFSVHFGVELAFLVLYMLRNRSAGPVSMAFRILTVIPFLAMYFFPPPDEVCDCWEYAKATEAVWALALVNCILNVFLSLILCCTAGPRAEAQVYSGPEGLGQH
jgi:hypothetical protein